MSKLEKAISAFNSLGTRRDPEFSPVAVLLVTLFYLFAVLSVPLLSPDRLIWLAIFPVLLAEYSGLGYVKVFLRSLWVIPLVALIGIFNPIIDTSAAFEIGALSISQGWVSFFSILIRGLLAMQAVIILIEMIGFYGVCSALRTLRVPTVLVTQLLLTYRYLTVLLEEALTMRRAREARGFGRRSYPLKMWGAFIGQLLLRSVDRAERIHKAMLARGFDGCMPESDRRDEVPVSRSIIFGLVASLVIALLRWLPLSIWFTKLFVR